MRTVGHGPPYEYPLKFGQFTMGRIGTATFGAILLHAILRAGQRTP
jgi:putative pyrimidine permease RutG